MLVPFEKITFLGPAATEVHFDFIIDFAIDYNRS